MKKLVLPIILVILMSGCVGQTTVQEKKNYESVAFNTSDGFQIAGNFYSGGSKGIILLHMLGRTKVDWKDFATELNNNGYSVLAIDLRGHGDSLKQNGRTVVYSSFREEDFNKMVLDVEAAKNFLKTRNIETVSIIGASIGANVALNYAANNPSIKSLVLLSPGLDYRGVKTEDSAKKYQRAVLLVASTDDSYSSSSVNSLGPMFKGNSQIKLYENIGHGTNMLGKKDLNNLILDWLSKTT